MIMAAMLDYLRRAYCPRIAFPMFAAPLADRMDNLHYNMKTIMAAIMNMVCWKNLWA